VLKSATADGRIGLHQPAVDDAGQHLYQRPSAVAAAQLDKAAAITLSRSVGVRGDVLQRFEHLIAQPHGIILVTRFR
jgi:uncharacterized protein YdeI (BOF family)